MENQNNKRKLTRNKNIFTKMKIIFNFVIITTIFVQRLSYSKSFFLEHKTPKISPEHKSKENHSRYNIENNSYLAHIFKVFFEKDLLYNNILEVEEKENKKDIFKNIESINLENVIYYIRKIFNNFYGIIPFEIIFIIYFIWKNIDRNKRNKKNNITRLRRFNISIKSLIIIILIIQKTICNQINPPNYNFSKIILKIKGIGYRNIFGKDEGYVFESIYYPDEIIINGYKQNIINHSYYFN